MSIYALFDPHDFSYCGDLVCQWIMKSLMGGTVWLCQMMRRIPSLTHGLTSSKRLHSGLPFTEWERTRKNCEDCLYVSVLMTTLTSMMLDWWPSSRQGQGRSGGWCRWRMRRWIHGRQRVAGRGCSTLCRNIMSKQRAKAGQADSAVFVGVGKVGTCLGHKTLHRCFGILCIFYLHWSTIDGNCK